MNTKKISLTASVASATLAISVGFSQAATIAELESLLPGIIDNDTPGNAQSINPLSFTVVADPNIAYTPAYKSVTVNATGDDTQDWFTFFHSGGLLVIDIDAASVGLNTEIALWQNVFPDNGVLIANNDDNINGIDLGSSTNLDSHLEFADLASGLYYISVSSYDTIFTTGFGVSGPGVADQASYQLNITSGIPEPSAALLGGLGVLTLLRRRRA